MAFPRSPSVPPLAGEMQGAGEIQGPGNLHNNSKFSLFYVCFVCLCRCIMLNTLFATLLIV